MPSNVVYKAIQDQDGFIWVCTEKGVAKYDGYSFKSIGNIGKKLSSNDVWELIIDKYDRKWLFTMDSEPIIITKDKTYSLNELAGLPSGTLQTWSLNSYTLKYGTNQNFILINKTDTAVYYLNESNKLVNIPLPREIALKFILRYKMIISFEENKLSILDFSGGMQTYNMKGRLLQNKPGPQLGYEANIHQEELFSTDTKLSFFNNYKKLYKISHDNVKEMRYNVQKEKPFTIIGTGQKNIFIKENDIIFTLDKETEQKNIFTKTIKGARQVFEDREKNIWIASQEDGMYLIPYHSKKTKIYNETNGLVYPKITAMAFDKDGELYLGNNYGTALTIFNGLTFRTIPKDNRKDYFIHVDNDKNVWLSGINIITKYKINVKTKGNNIVRNNSKQIGNRVVNDFSLHPKSYCLNGNYLYFGRMKLYTAQLINQTLHVDSIWQSQHTIYAMASKSAHEIFIGTTHGIYTLNTVTKKTDTIHSPELTGNIRDLHHLKNTLWVATDKHGLVKYNPNTNKCSTFKSLSGKNVSDIHYDSVKNALWISTNKGLFRLSEKGNKLYDIKQFTTSNGLPTNEVNCCLTRDNKIYVGTARGLAILPDEEIDLSYKPQIYRTRFNVNNKDLPISSTYDLKHDENHIIIELTALSFSSLGNVTYRYQLQGADNKWSEGKTRTLEYPSLPPGKYTLIANATDANGQETSNQIKIRINIESPISQKWWFQILLILLALGLISLFFYWRSQEKSKKIELEKQFSNLKLEALQSQLNSHFIFNALNAIQAYIIQKDERQASKYMSQFAKLMRAFLDSSRNRTISIADEIEFIRTYVSLESIIYEDKFDTEINIESALDLSQKIPSNITQPFIENAILHGLMPLKRKGKLSISFKKMSELVAQCIISDNGVGYNASAKNKTIKSKSHGQNIIHERIGILKKDHKLDVDIEIINRKKQSNEDGTIIIINFKNNGAD